MTETKPLNWDPSTNIVAYRDVEASSNYADTAALEAYRTLLLKKSAGAAEAISRLCPGRTGLRVTELCSGSGRVLYALDRLGRLEAGTGVEVSPSRHLFAEAWKATLGTARVRNVNSSAGDYAWPSDPLDLVVAIDGAISYLYPCDPAMPRRILSEAHRVLMPGGRVLLEFDVLSKVQVDELRSSGRTRTWNAGDAKDTYTFALYETTVSDWPHMVVQNLSVYLPRDGGPAREKRELYKYYSRAELQSLVEEVGFEASFHGSFALEPFGEDSRSLVCVLTRRPD